MHPLTEALLRANTKDLTQKGWKPDEQRRCFKKADALLDYIAQVPTEDYLKGMWHSRIRPISVAGLECTLKRGMPSERMQAQSLEVLETLLSIGDNLLKRASWLFKKYPALFKAKYASSPQAFAKDIHGFFICGRLVPENSFPGFKTGENPAFSKDKNFIEKCIEMYNDSVFEMAEFKSFNTGPKEPYVQWKKNKKAGQAFLDRQLAWQDEIAQLALKTKVSTKLNAMELTHHIQMKKQKTI